MGYSDGSLIVDTGLNNAGFFRDARQFKGAVESLKNTVNRVGQDMAKTGNAFADVMTGSMGAVNKLNSGIEETKSLIEDEIREIQRAGEMANEFRKLARAEEEMTAAQKNLDWDSDEFAALDIELEKVADRMRELNNAANSFEGIRIGRWAESGMFARLQYEFAAAEQRLRALNAAQIELQETAQSDTQAQKAAADAARTAETEAAALESVAEAANEAAAALENKAAAEQKAPRHIITDEEYEELVRAGTAISEAQRNMERAAGINVVRETLSISEAITREIQRTEEAYQAKLEKINAVESAMEATRDVVREISDVTEQSASNIGNKFTSALETARSAAARFFDAFAAYYAKAPAESNAVAQGMEQVADNAGSAARAVESVGRQSGGAAARLAKLAAGGVLGFLRKLANGAKNAAIQLAKLSGRALASGIRSIGSAASRAGKALFGLGKRARQSNGGIQLSLRNILRYGLGIRSLFVLFNRLRSAIKEGFDTLANYDPRVRAALASLKGSLNGLKGSLAGAFAPILTAIAPALTTFINLLAQAISSIGMFMAALTGQGYYMAAKGIEAVDSAAGGASGSVKELKRQLAGFDELNILSAGSSGGGGGGGSAGTGYVYDRIPLEGGIADFVQRMKQLFEAGEYEEIGAIIADGINGAFQRVQDYIRWENIGGVVTKYVDAFAGVFNGLVGRIKWRKIGATFGDGLNTIINTLNRWLEKLNFKNVGTAIGEALNGMLERVNFAKAGATLASMLTAKLVVAANALATFDWEKFGPKLAEGFNSFIGKLDEVIGGIDWEDMARKMVRGLNGFIRHIEWRELGDTIAKRAESLIDMLKAALTEFEWGDTGDRFAEALNGFFQRKSLWEKAAETIDTAIKDLLDFTKSFLVRFDARTAAQRIRDALERIDWKGIASDFWDAAKTAFEKAGDFLDVLLGGSSTNRVVENASDIYSEVLTGGGSSNKSIAYRLGKKLGEIVGSIPWSNIIKSLSTIIGDAFSGLWDGLFDTENGTVAIGLTAAFLGLEALFSSKINLLGKTLETGISGLFSKLGAFGAAVSLIGGAGAWTGTQLYNAFKANGGGAVIEETGRALTGAVTEYVKNHELPKDKTYNTGDAAADIITYLTKDGIKALDKRQDEYDRAKDDPFSDSNRTQFGTISAHQLYFNGNEFQRNTQAVEDNTKAQKDKGGYAVHFVRENGLEAGWDSTSAREEKKRQRQMNQSFAIFESDPGYVSDGLTWDDIYAKNTSVDVAVNFRPAGENKTGYANGGLLKYLQAIFAPGTDEETRIQLIRDGWNTVSGWVETLRGAANVVQKIGLARHLWQTVSGWVNGLKGNTKVEQAVGLIKTAWSTVSAWVNGLKGSTKVEQAVDLVKGWIGSAKSYLGLDSGNLDSTAWVDADSPWQNSSYQAKRYLGLDALTAVVEVDADTTKFQNKLNGITFSKSYQTAKKAGGGIITAGGVSRAFANGGAVTAGGRTRWWNSIPRYAGGTSRAHGTLFAAGEAGPEIVGHVNGRTEILNQSQLAQTMRGAVTGGMIAALRGIEFRLPAMATGSVVPYDVSAQIAKSSAELQSTLDANNEDLIQTIISVAGQIVAAVNGLQAQQRQGAGTGALNVQQVINEINRRTQMFAMSPLNG